VFSTDRGVGCMDKDTGIPFYKGPLIDNVDDCLPIADLKKC